METYRVRVTAEQFGGSVMDSVCYVKSDSSDVADLQEAIDNHPLNTAKSWKFMELA